MSHLDRLAGNLERVTGDLARIGKCPCAVTAHGHENNAIRIPRITHDRMSNVRSDFLRQGPYGDWGNAVEAMGAGDGRFRSGGVVGCFPAGRHVKTSSST